MDRETRLMLAADDRLLQSIGVKTASCRYCDSPATKNVSWNDGDSVTQVCDDHVGMAKNRAKMQDGAQATVSAIGEEKYLPAGRALPKNQKCSDEGCDAQATKRVIWADGRAYLPACDEHVEITKKRLIDKNGAMAEIVGVRDIKAAGIDTDPDPSPNPGAAKLREYWVHGEGAAKIGWGSHGDFNKCVRHLRKYVGTRAEGLCNVYHTAALGAAPGHGHGKSILDRVAMLGVEIKSATEFVPDIPEALIEATLGTKADGSLPAVPKKLRPCKSEDDPGPCRWDAKKNGNGKGKSFTSVPDGKGGNVSYFDDGSASHYDADGNEKKYSKDDVAKMKTSSSAKKPGTSSSGSGSSGAAKKAPAKKAPAKKEPQNNNSSFNSLHPRNPDGTFAYKNDSGKGTAERGTKDKVTGKDGKVHGRISRAQNQLVALGLLDPKAGRNGKAVDGYFGPKTEAAVAKFQKQNKMKPTGKLDAATIKALGDAASKKKGGTASRAASAIAGAAKKKSLIVTKAFPSVVDLGGGITKVVFETKAAVTYGHDSDEGGSSVGMEYKSVGVSGVKTLDGDGSGLVEAIVSVTGIVDNVKDIIAPGAYQKSLKARTPKGVWHHNWHESVSRTEGIEELPPGHADLPKQLPNGDPWPAEAGALKVMTRFNLDTQRGREAYADVKFFGAQQEWSIGYNVPVGGATIDSKTGIRTIETLDLYEYSPVLFGAMPVARTASVKSAQEVFATLLKSVDREELLVETKDFLNDLIDAKGEKPMAQEEEDLDEEMEPGDEEDQGLEEDDMEDEEDSEEEKAMPMLSAAHGDMVAKCISALQDLLDSLGSGSDREPPSEEMAEEKMRRKKRGGGSAGCKSLEELVSAVFDDDAIVSSAKSFDEAVTSSDMGAMETAATAVLDAVEEAIDNGEDAETYSDLAEYIANAVEEADSSEDDEEAPAEDADSEDEEQPGEKVLMSLAEFKDVFGNLDNLLAN